MSFKSKQIIDGFKKAIENKESRATSPYDAVATVMRVDGDIAYVKIPGSETETPVKLTINAVPGDSVQVRIKSNGSFIMGNASAPPTDNTYARQVSTQLTQEVENTNVVVGAVQKVVNAVKKIADNTNQYFWHTETGTDTGAHITEIPQEEFLEDPENGGGNLLARSNGIAVRDGLTELASFSTNGIVLNNPYGDPILDASASDQSSSYLFREDLYNTGDYGTGVALPATFNITSPHFHDIGAQDGLIIYGRAMPLPKITGVDFTDDFTITTPWDGNTTLSFVYDKDAKTLTVSSSGQTTDLSYVSIVWKSEYNAPRYSLGSRVGEDGDYSVIIGDNLSAKYPNQIAIGKSNANYENDVFEIGWGTPGNEKNIFRITQDGDIYSDFLGWVRTGAAQLSISDRTFSNTSSVIISSQVNAYAFGRMFEPVSAGIRIKEEGYYKLSTYCLWSDVPNTTNARAFALCHDGSAGSYYDGYVICRDAAWESRSGTAIVSIPAGTIIQLTQRSEGGTCTIKYACGIIEPIL